MSEQTFLLPDLGEGLTEAQIVEWKVKVGDSVLVDQVIVEVETAKAVVELPVPFAGTVLALHGDPGATLCVGAPVVTVAAVEQASAGSGNVLIGYGTTAAVSRSRPGRRRAAVRPAVTPATATATATTVKVISPAVRKLARDNGVDLVELSATGPGGVIVRADVEEARAAVGNADGEQRVPITGLRKVIGAKLSVSRREIPDATTWVDVDATALLDARRRIAAATKQDVSLLALLARFAIAALREFPELNSSVDTARSEIVRYRHVNLGIAVQTQRGLLVPVIKGADTMDTVTLSAALAQTVQAARDGKLPPAQLSGGTFTLNNYGLFGVDGSTPIINHPEVAILGVGRIVDRPWVADGELAVRKVTQVCVSFDHRVCDGGTAAGFLRLFADLVENPVAALGRC
ncbi:branched-chain alpha-keto acid dehydrogenase subunit E2 [Mycobacterium intermedium]|uniref:Dihydrolipoamide acetyltransferase component of pyruvate dehydrogenase complex n=1 Tax=Mycobacterium intermedium TaxID=28445 RepID=A0A1E3S7K0_MYCIE|nr:dihydrolipoamide acetyltransferase family protein [Mycobacterium intermedium]MCV6963596.1 2-oxo acid dehydrogenase subunit E2 [Mycobacterium intermedium]ODQ97622.1 branched-chain alpha-keto acid dehydrogenase subunit E2 [Mycobacterium intermedium]OPE46735.1 branched-chain alpha-keto acid dehydrogenase subunit E2 [Mycobacterium intermedium]ORB09640.1 branched-chain alpha-keto acid dehydrogenase subunit E2 [Mycobacterium intermedium]